MVWPHTNAEKFCPTWHWDLVKDTERKLCISLYRREDFKMGNIPESFAHRLTSDLLLKFHHEVEEDPAVNVGTLEKWHAILHSCA